MTVQESQATATADDDANADDIADRSGPAVDPVLRDQVVADICALLPKVLKREVPDASADSTLMTALGMSSTSALELVLELEERMLREISIEDLGREHFHSVGTLAAYIAGNLLPEE